jgi:hypothetical protein
VAVQTRANDFINTARLTDIKVETLLSRKNETFYGEHPWARPPRTNHPLVDLGLAVLNWAIDGITNTWDTVVNWYQENKDAIHQVLKIIGRILIGVAFIALAILTGGVALVGLKVAIAIVAISTVAGGVYAGVTGGNLLDIIEGMSKGFMGGGIALFAAGFVLCLGVKGGFASGLVKFTGGKAKLSGLGKITAGGLGGGLDGLYSAIFDGKCMITGMWQGLQVGLLFGGLSAGIGKIFPNIPEVGVRSSLIDFTKNITKDFFKKWVFKKPDSNYSSWSPPVFTPFAPQTKQSLGTLAAKGV